LKLNEDANKKRNGHTRNERKNQKVGTPTHHDHPINESRCNPIPPPGGGNVSAELLPSRVISIA